MLSDVDQKLTAPEGLDMGDTTMEAESFAEISDLHQNPRAP